MTGGIHNDRGNIPDFSDEKMEIALGTIREAIVWSSPAGEILWVNSSLGRMLNMQEDEEPLTNVVAQIPLYRDGDRVNMGLHPVSLVAATGRRISSIYDVSSAKRKFIAEIIACPVEIESEALSVILIFRDISMQVEVLERLEKKNCALAEAHRELKEHQSQLIQSEKMAAFGLLAAGIAHEINNPITFIRSNFNMLSRYHEDCKPLINAVLRAGGDCPECREIGVMVQACNLSLLAADFEAIIEESRGGAEQIIRIVKGLMKFAHTDPGTLSFVDLNEILEQSLLIVWSEIKYKADVERHYGELPPIVGNSRELGQVFINLLVNAIQSFEERGTITVRTIKEADGIRIQIEDTGCGIPRAIHGRIFDPFFTTKPIGSGTGLGLHVSRKIIEGHGGTIQVESSEGAGTIMIVILPMNSDLYREFSGDSSAAVP